MKTALIGDAPLLDYLESHAERVLAREPAVITELVRRCVRVKARVVGEDAREQGFRAALNLGHTIGHALEAVAGFDRLSHGEAISLGLVAALRLGERLGVTAPDLVTRIIALLDRLGLPTDLSKEPLEQAASLIGLDKKRRGSRRQVRAGASAPATSSSARSSCASWSARRASSRRPESGRGPRARRAAFEMPRSRHDPMKRAYMACRARITRRLWRPDPRRLLGCDLSSW